MEDWDKINAVDRMQKYIMSHIDEEMKNAFSSTVTVQAASAPARKLIVLRAEKATDYFSYCEEKGCAWEGL